MATVAAMVFEHHQKNDKTYNVKIRVYHKGEKKYIDTAHFVTKRQLDEKFKIKDKFLIKLLDKTLDDYRETISDLGTNIDFFTCEGLRDYLENKDKDIDIIKFADQHIERLKSEDREPYSRSFRIVRNSLVDYFHRETVSINEINSNMLFAYEKFLKSERLLIRKNFDGGEKKIVSKGLSEHGLHNHMRDLRTLFNAARDIYNNEDLGLYRIKHYPFKKYKVGSAPLTESRANTIEEVIQIRDCKPAPDSLAELARDMYMLSFYLCGMNAVDIYKCTEKKIKGGRLEYNRSKTQSRRKDKAFISIKVIEEAAPLLMKYIKLLPIRFKTYDNLDSALYQGMQKLRVLTGVDEITMYWARHTFATLARNKCRMSKDDIGQALNHIDHGHRTTDIYIAKDWSIVDSVQLAVISLFRDFTAVSDEQSANTTDTINTLSPLNNRLLMKVI